MANSFIAIDEPAATDKKLDTEQLTVGANTVERERVILSGAGATDFALPVAHDAADAGNPLKIGGKAQSSAPADVSATGDRVDAYFDMKGRLKVDAGDVVVPINDNAGSITVDNAGLTELAAAINASSQVDVNIAASGATVSVDIVTALPAGTNNIGDVDIASIAAGDNNIGNVDIVTMPNVTLAAGTNTNEVVGDAAHDDAVAGNPLSMGATAHEGRRTAVSADGDAVRVAADRHGRLQVVGSDITEVAAGQTTSSGDTSMLAATAATRRKIMRVEASNSHATTANTVGIKTNSINSNAVFGKKYLPAAGGLAVWTFPGGYLLSGANEAININCSAAGQIEWTLYYESVAD